jgi:hypothetical protein
MHRSQRFQQKDHWVLVDNSPSSKTAKHEWPTVVQPTRHQSTSSAVADHERRERRPAEDRNRRERSPIIIDASEDDRDRRYPHIIISANEDDRDRWQRPIIVYTGEDDRNHPPVIVLSEDDRHRSSVNISSENENDHRPPPPVVVHTGEDFRGRRRRQTTGMSSEDGSGQRSPPPVVVHTGEDDRDRRRSSPIFISADSDDDDHLDSSAVSLNGEDDRSSTHTFHTADGDGRNYRDRRPTVLPTPVIGFSEERTQTTHSRRQQSAAVQDWYQPRAPVILIPQETNMSHLGMQPSTIDEDWPAAPSARQPRFITSINTSTVSTNYIEATTRRSSTLQKNRTSNGTRSDSIFSFSSRTTMSARIGRIMGLRANPSPRSSYSSNY